MFGSIILGVAVYDMASLASAMSADADNEFEQALLDSASPGIGLILTGIAGIAILVLSVIGIVKARAIEPGARPREPPDPHPRAWLYPSRDRARLVVLR